MEKETVSGPVICATRGGQACHRAQNRAIELAKEQGSELIFLFVADSSFAEPMSEPLREALVDELARLGKSLMHVAQERAGNENLVTQTVVRQGVVGPTLEEYAREVGASVVVVGSPQASSGLQTFTLETLGDFVASLRQATGAQVVVVE